MNATHLSDHEIQQYALTKENCSRQILLHVEQCLQCRDEALTYQLLFKDLKQQTAPAFDFDLAEQILNQLPSSKPKPVFNFYLISAVLIFVVLAVALTAYLSAGISSVLNWLIIISFSILFAGLLTDHYRHYKRKLEILNHPNLQH